MALQIHFPNHDLVLLSPLLLEYLLHLLLRQKHLLVLAAQALTHVAATYSSFEAFAVVPIATDLFASTSSGVENLLLSLLLHHTVLFPKSKWVYFLRLLNYELPHFLEFVSVQAVIAATFLSASPSVLEAYTVQP